MKAILMSIQSPHACNILNLIKLLEMRKKFPKDYVGWVYIYVTKALPHLSKTYVGDYEVYDDTQWDKEWLDLNGTVVARFWCDKVEDFGSKYAYAMKDQHFYDILKGACLTVRDLTEYAHFTHEQLIKGKANLYAIHISNLEIFDEPKEISEFYAYSDKKLKLNYHQEARWLTSLTRAPQSWCWIEV